MLTEGAREHAANQEYRKVDVQFCFKCRYLLRMYRRREQQAEGIAPLKPLYSNVLRLAKRLSLDGKPFSNYTLESGGVNAYKCSTFQSSSRNTVRKWELAAAVY